MHINALDVLMYFALYGISLVNSLTADTSLLFCGLAGDNYSVNTLHFPGLSAANPVHEKLLLYTVPCTCGKGTGRTKIIIHVVAEQPN